MNILILLLISVSALKANVVPIKDNLLFAFDRCRSLQVDLDQGTLKESITSSFDLHCRKVLEKSFDFKCDFFETGSIKISEQLEFSGGTNLGLGNLKDKSGREIKFILGKKFASFSSEIEKKLCVGIFIPEQDALKKRASSGVSD